jgi:hypothetical protein
MAQLPFLALGILQPIRRLEGVTHFGLLPESGTKQEFLEKRMKKNFGPRKKTFLCRFRTFDQLDGLVQNNFGLLPKALLNVNRV